MPKFKVTAKVTHELELVIEADSLSEAQNIGDYELITDDYEIIHSEFNFLGVQELENN